jgi:hypothetical protein
MTGQKAGNALTLAAGIRDLKGAGDQVSLWYGMITRILLDLDRAGNQAGVTEVTRLLAGTWNELTDKGGGCVPVSVRPSGSEAADMVTAELARAFGELGMSPEGALRNAERIRRVYQLAFTADNGREAPPVLTPAQRYENAVARFGDAAATVHRAREAARQMTEDADREYAEAMAWLRTFEKSPGIPKDEYLEGTDNRGSDG